MRSGGVSVGVGTIAELSKEAVMVVHGREQLGVAALDRHRATVGSVRTVWFDRSDNRPPAAAGGDFATGHYKGQCADGEYVAGVAFTRRVGSAGSPDALLCRPANG